MAIQIPVQTISYLGIYTMEGDPPVAIPRSLDWTQNPSAYMFFENIAGKVILLIRNRALSGSFSMRVSAMQHFIEIPSSIPIIAPPIYEVPPLSVQVFGPFSNNFGDSNHMINFQLYGSPGLTYIDVAAIRFPE